MKSLGLLVARLLFAMALYAVMSVSVDAALGEPLAQGWSLRNALFGLMGGIVAMLVIRPKPRSHEPR